MKTGLRCVCILWMVSLVAPAGSAEKLKAGPGILEKAWTTIKENPIATVFTIGGAVLIAKYIASKVTILRKPSAPIKPSEPSPAAKEVTGSAGSKDSLETPPDPTNTGTPNSPTDQEAPPLQGDGVGPEALVEGSK